MSEPETYTVEGDDTKRLVPNYGSPPEPLDYEVKEEEPEQPEE